MVMLQLPDRGPGAVTRRARTHLLTWRGGNGGVSLQIMGPPDPGGVLVLARELTSAG